MVFDSTLWNEGYGWSHFSHWPIDTWRKKVHISGCHKVPTLIRFLIGFGCLTGSLWELPSIQVIDSANYSVLRMNLSTLSIIIINSSTNGRKIFIKLHLYEVLFMHKLAPVWILVRYWHGWSTLKWIRNDSLEIRDAYIKKWSELKNEGEKKGEYPKVNEKWIKGNGKWIPNYHPRNSNLWKVKGLYTLHLISVTSS